MPRPDIEAGAEEFFTARADPSRRSILAALAAGGPATATDLVDRLPITRQAIAKPPLRSSPMQVAQQFLAALARGWDGQLDARRDQLNR